MADVPVSALQTKTAQFEATIRSAHALLQAGLISDATNLLAAFSPEVNRRVDASFVGDGMFEPHLPKFVAMHAIVGAEIIVPVMDD